MKKALLLCTSHNDLGLVKALKKLGYFIVATGNRDNSPGEKWVDKWVRADYSDKELILQIAKDEKIDAICQCCNDFGVYTASYVAEQLGLPGYDSYETTLTLHNKDRFKAFAKDNDIISPVSVGFDEEEKAIDAIRTMELPLIVKPVDCSAGNGISVVENLEDAEAAIRLAFSKSRLGRIVVEPYLKGTQHGFCTFLYNKKVVAWCSNDEYSIVNPYRVEIDTFPATGWEKCYKILIEQIEKIADILDLKDGIFHLQYIYADGKPWIIEVMRRILGNMYHVPSNEFSGFSWEYWETKARCGLDCSDFPSGVQGKGCFGYKTILAPHNGEITDITIPKEYSKYIYDSFYLMNVGEVVKNYKQEPVGFLFMMFANDEEMHRVLIDEYRNDLVGVKECADE
ncbi:MAG: ATP-grasp domain-containing protein [Lachnospiraceae bacterium]|nr:ATP-grasp domain-containing protein [Candidatus Colinaster equi]